MKPVSIFLNRREKGNPCNGIILSLPQKKKFQKPPLADKVNIIAFWDCEGVILVDALLGRETTRIPTSGCWQNTGSISNKFDLTRIQHKSCFRMTVQGHTEVWRLPKPLQNMIEMLPNHPYSPNLAPSGFHIFWALKYVMCGIKVETWWWCDSHNENLARWGGHIMVMIRLRHTCFLLTLGHRSWWRLCGNIGYGVKNPS